MVDIQVLVDLRTEIGEGPVWDFRTRALVFVDIPNGVIYRAAVDGATEVWGTGGSVGAIGLWGMSGFILGTGTGVSAASSWRGQMTLASTLQLPTGLRMNDGQVAPDGTFWIGSMAWDARENAGSLYALGLDGSTSVVLNELTISNGIGWSGDGQTMFFIDSATRSLDAFDYRPGTISNRRTVLQFQEGLPDGLCVDEEDHIWVAQYGVGKVQRISPKGRPVASLNFPCPLVTSCCLGGDDLDLLFVTTASVDTPPSRRHLDHAGAVFVADVGVRGRPANVFGWTRSEP